MDWLSDLPLTPHQRELYDKLINLRDQIAYTYAATQNKKANADACAYKELANLRIEFTKTLQAIFKDKNHVSN